MEGRPIGFKLDKASTGMRLSIVMIVQLELSGLRGGPAFCRGVRRKALATGDG